MKSALRIIPVFVAFYCMGFVDIVGTAVKYVAKDFDLSQSTSQILTMMIFVWFGVFAIPTGLLQDRFGKKKLVLFGLLCTAVSMLIPFIIYNYLFILIGFIFLGVGNTVIQVSLNPLLYDVSGKGSYSSNMSLSQFIKAIASLLGPIIAVFFVNYTGNWKYVFLVYGGLSILSALWLMLIPITETREKTERASFASCFRLLGNPFILSMVIGIFIVVGLDVGMNTGIPFFLESFNLTTEQATLGISIYFFSLMASRFFGAILLKKFLPKHFLVISACITLVGLVVLILSNNDLLAKAGIVIVGIGSANIFPLIFSISIEKIPERSNEISGLMIMAIAGGAVFPYLMSLISEHISERAGIIFLFLISAYLLVLSLMHIRKQKASE